MAEEELIAGCFAVDLGRKLPSAGGGLPAFAVIDRIEGRSGLMAVQARSGAPPRATALQQMVRIGVAGVLSPLGHGPARDDSGGMSWYVICPLPPGPPLLPAAARDFPPWGERELIEFVLRPAARALEALQGRHLTHRALRPDNIFRAGPADPVTLGCAWAGPPGALQPVLYEPPYSAMCLPSGRGEGSIADDVYALGVTLLVLAGGRVPLAELDPQEIVRRKLELGSFAALTGEERMSPLIMDLARGMLAEDPDHRPAPTLLADPGGARSRRVAARPPRRAQRPLEIGATAAWTARTLAHAIAIDPGAGIRALRTGAVDRWIRRSLGDGLLAARLEEIVRARGAQDQEDPREDAALAMRAVTSLDPLAPLCWSGIAFWPDGLGPMLAEDDANAAGVEEIATDIIGMEGVAIWASARAERCDVATLRLDAHQQRALLRQRGWGGGLERLRYALNPLLAARSRLLRAELVVRLADLLPALDRAAAAGIPPGQLPIDRDLAAFIAARSEQRVDAELAPIGEAKAPEHATLLLLRLYAGIQQRTGGPVLPALSRWLVGLVGPALAAFHGRAGRRRREAALAELVDSGRLTALLGVLDDAEGAAADRAGQLAALARVAEIDRELAEIRANAPARLQAARRLGQELVAAAGALALMLSITFALFA